ncbi:MAG: dihydropteroate synthase [Syntrophomonadaceae bacterium]|nr:dihydropteroate synthase [Syntrophomonadaceae bacterium]
MASDIVALLRERVLMLDGAMGTMLQQNGMRPGECPELFGVNNPATLKDIHGQYVDAGSDIIETNTFGGNRLKLDEYALGDRVHEINAEAVRIAKKAVGDRALVAASIGPSGRLLQPMGDVTFDDLYEVFAEQIRACAAGGADLISIETMTDIGEMRAALIAAQQNTRLPVITHMTFESDGRTMTGTDPINAALTLSAFQPLAIGANCSGGARELLKVLEQMAKYSSVPLSIEPNAGLPRLINDQTVFPDSPDEMAEYALLLREAGASIIGGCCGTTPAHIRAMADAVRGLGPGKKTTAKYFALTARSCHVLLGENQPLAFIGERINPTARKKLAQDIKDGKMQIVVNEAREQVKAGAPILDVNMGVPGIDEPAAMRQAVMGVQAAVDLPLSLDSTNPAALEEGLKNFVGRALINSTTGEEKQMRLVMPLARKYGAAILGLCLDDKGIPEKADGRMEVARRIYQTAKEYGLRDEDIYIDCLVKTASAEQENVMETITALRSVKSELGVGTVLGVSNVSHGLPARELLNSTYLAMAWAAGLDLPIMNPFDQRMMEVTRSAAVLLNRDPNCGEFISRYKDYKPGAAGGAVGNRHDVCTQCNIPELLGKQAAAPNVSVSPAPVPTAEAVEKTIFDRLKAMVLNGEREEIEAALLQALDEQKHEPLEIINRGLIPGIEAAGDLYDKKQYFLPQLMMSAETMKRAFAIVKPRMAEDKSQEKGVIIMATVAGDIHDIGKNIVCVMLENYGFKVIDLGKDVDSELIIDMAERSGADIVGLSALMTTTMPAMKEVIQGIKEKKLKCKIMVGGAVLNQEYADSIGADAYSRDARDAVVKAQSLLS